MTIRELIELDKFIELEVIKREKVELDKFLEQVDMHEICMWTSTVFRYFLRNHIARKKIDSILELHQARQKRAQKRIRRDKVK